MHISNEKDKSTQGEIVKGLAKAKLYALKMWKRFSRLIQSPSPPLYGTFHQILRNRRRQQAKFRLLLLFVLLSGVLLAGYPWEGWGNLKSHPYLERFLTDVLPRLGDAMMIAPLLAFLVEIAAAGELLDQFVANVSHHMIGYLLPMELRYHLFNYLTANFVRRTWFVEYRFTGWPGAPGYFQLVTMMQFELENSSDSKKCYSYTYELAKSFYPAVGKAEIRHIRATLDEVKIFDSVEDKLEGLIKESEHYLTFVKDVEISRPPHGVYKFVAESIECVQERSDSHFTARIPVLKTVVRVFYPPKELTMDLHLSFGPDTVLSKTTLIDGIEWVVNSPMLPGQSFITSWKKAEEDKGIVTTEKP